VLSPSAKPVKGLGFADRVFVLHLPKATKSGVATPRADIDLIAQPLKQAVALKINEASRVEE
jgi:phage-related protein